MDGFLEDVGSNEDVGPNDDVGIMDGVVDGDVVGIDEEVGDEVGEERKKILSCCRCCFVVGDIDGLCEGGGCGSSSLLGSLTKKKNAISNR